MIPSKGSLPFNFPKKNNDNCFFNPHTAPNGGAGQAAENKLSREEENELFAALNISTSRKYQKGETHFSTQLNSVRVKFRTKTQGAIVIYRFGVDLTPPTQFS